MKIDRLLGITIFLLNRSKVSARVLSERFEVSPRTIQRDIEALGKAGIPVMATYGAGGGYEIVNSFKMEKQAANDDDYAFILTALKGLSTAYDNPKVNATLEKILSVARPGLSSQNICLDFSVLREGDKTSEWLKLLQAAVSVKKTVGFDYTNAENIQTGRSVEPLAVTYKWYSWYLFGYCTLKRDYRFFKLARMSNLKMTDKPFMSDHENVDSLLARAADSRKYLDIKLFCKADVKIQVIEYLSGSIEKEFTNGDFIINLHLPENEQAWLGTILGFGDKAIVMEPVSLKNKLQKKAQEILSAYQ